MECPENGWNYSKLAGIAAVFRSTQVPFQHGVTAGKHARQPRWHPGWEKAHRSRPTGAHGRQTQPGVIPEATINLLNCLTGTGNRFLVRVGLHGSFFFRYIRFFPGTSHALFKSVLSVCWGSPRPAVGPGRSRTRRSGHRFNPWIE